jgi:thioredoxin reductase
MRDVIIVGGGPAGLNAALILGRCRRDVLLCDAGTPRNAVSPRTWGVFTRDGTPPFEMRARAQADLERYATVERREVAVVRAERQGSAFEVALADGSRETARKLILATGLHQALPSVEGFEAYWGHGVHSCPYCDGYENRDRPLVAYAHGQSAKGMALELTVWSRDVTLCTDAHATAFTDHDRQRLERHGIAVVETATQRLEGDGRQHVPLPRRLPDADAVRSLRSHHPARLRSQQQGDRSHRRVRDHQRAGSVRGGRCVPQGPVRRRRRRRGRHGGVCRQHRAPARGRRLRSRR